MQTPPQFPGQIQIPIPMQLTLQPQALVQTAPQATAQLTAEYYSDKSIAVFGDTKPWATDLRTLGGSFNYNLRGRPGWIFQKTLEPQLMQFIANANARMVQPTPYQQKPPTPKATQPAQMVPMGFTQQAMNPQQAMAQLTQAQPALPQIQPLPQTQTTLPLPRPLVPAPITAQPAQTIPVNFPNMFTAADGLTYQILLYTVPVPLVHQPMQLKIGTSTLDYTVLRYAKEGGPIDDILVMPVPKKDETTDTNAVTAPSRAVIINGKWQIFGLTDEHTITFLPATPIQID